MERNNNFNRVEELLQRFMDGQTTLDEERELERFFRQARLLPENLQPYREMFACFDNGLKLPGETTGRSGRRKTLWRTVAAAAIVAAEKITILTFCLPHFIYDSGTRFSS